MDFEDASSFATELPISLDVPPPIREFMTMSLCSAFLDRKSNEEWVGYMRHIADNLSPVTTPTCEQFASFAMLFCVPSVMVYKVVDSLNRRGTKVSFETLIDTIPSALSLFTLKEVLQDMRQPPDLQIGVADDIALCEGIEAQCRENLRLTFEAWAKSPEIEIADLQLLNTPLGKLKEQQTLEALYTVRTSDATEEELDKA